MVDLEHAKERIAPYIEYYNQKRLHSAIGYVTPEDKLNGRAELVQAQREQKL
jgi:putative transposase